MKKDNSYPIWIKAGYNLFAEEGHEGIQIERLSRITGLNKSGFYHYFGDVFEFRKHLTSEHERITDQMLDLISLLDSYDPGFFKLMIQYENTCLFHIQLVRNRHIKLFLETHERINKKIDHKTYPLFIKEVGLSEDTAMPFYEMVRDMFYTRVDLKSFDYESLHSIMEEIKTLIPNILRKKPNE